MNVCRQTYSFPEVKLRRLRRKTYDDKYDILDKNQHTILATLIWAIWGHATGQSMVFWPHCPKLMYAI